MLPAGQRLRRRSDFAATIRSGRRSGRRTLVLHLVTGTDHAVLADDSPRRVVAPPSSSVGFVVSRAVGNSVVRHRVTRRLRAVVGPRLVLLPPGSSVVVRALPPAAAAPSAVLAADVDQALRRLGFS